MAKKLQANLPCRNRCRGAAAIELALILMVMVSLTVGTIEVGRALYAYETLAKGARTAARYLSVGEPESGPRQVNAKNIVVYGTETAGTTPLLPNLTTSMVFILEPIANPEVNSVDAGSPAGAMNMVTVSISGYPISPWMASVFPGITLETISVTVPFVFF